ncbi:MAG: hypothetical protein GYB31_17145 [Bacteroidetes bacterium]|nr:hypothetical protein [Bacteroidota bacterium]
MKKILLSLSFSVAFIAAAFAQRALEPIIADALKSPQVQEVFQGKRYYQILANEVVNPDNCNLSLISLDRPVRFYNDGYTSASGDEYIEARDCIMFMKVIYDPKEGYRVLVQDINSGMNIFLSKSAF